ncbi:MAG: hypothetical protein HPY58_09210 [Firmicutes bacterium]|nr:hypothetical protein [Bacillota bacterium]
MAVVAPWGVQLGYLRASLAAILAHRYARGEVFAARVAAVMGPDNDPNEQLYIEVWSEGHYKGDLVQAEPLGGEAGGDVKPVKKMDLASDEETGQETEKGHA